MELLYSQSLTFVVMLGYGFLLGLFFHLYQFVIKKINPGKIMLIMADLSFGIITGILGFIVLLLTNRGEMRFFVILSIFLGFLMYNIFKRMLKSF